MIGYVTLGTNDLPRAAAFYDLLLGEIGAGRLWETARGIAWGIADGQPMLALMKPFNGEPATAGNGVMVGFALATREAVDRMHGMAISMGCRNEGSVGLRAADWYCGYFRDPEGNKLLAYSMAS
jgi:catechol 2,3-dioxygenase-like lactoylglutathione lyase family enzyme